MTSPLGQQIPLARARQCPPKQHGWEKKDGSMRGGGWGSRAEAGVIGEREWVLGRVARCCGSLMDAVVPQVKRAPALKPGLLKSFAHFYLVQGHVHVVVRNSVQQ